MADWAGGELIGMALCWRLDRRDGVMIGFTSHDRDLEVGGLNYHAAPGMLPSAIRLTEGFEVDTLDVAGALSHALIREEDLAAGRWDGAAARLFAVDWSDEGAEPVPLARGEIGDVGVAGDGFTAELRGPTALLERPVVETTQPHCRAALGDRRCRVDLSGRTAIARVTAADGAAVTIDLGAAEGRWAWGEARWLDGPNGGIASAVAASDGYGLTLREAPPFPVAAGARVMLTEGCDGRFESCMFRFANTANFRGEPHLPGNDLLMRYPGA